MKTLCAAKFVNMTTKTLSILVAGISLGLMAPAAAQDSGLAKLQNIDWTEAHRAELEDLLGDRIRATSFMTALTGDVTLYVGEHLFVDLDGDNRLELVASIDYSGRAFYATVAVIHQAGHRLDYQFFGGDGK